MRDWRIWVLACAMFAIAIADMAFSSNLVLLAFLWVPVLLSAPFAGARNTAALSTLALLLNLIVGALVPYYDDPSYWVRLIAMIAVAGFAIYLSGLTESNRRQLAELSLTDALTGLPNRRLLDDRLQSALRQRNRHLSAAVLYVDLDRFKAVNGTYGHPIGDQVLVEVSRRFQRHLRQGDTLARVGGDEFVIVCPPSIHAERELQQLGARLISALHEPFPGRTVDIGATVGAVLIPPGATGSAHDYLQEADDTLMRRKETEPGTMSLKITQFAASDGKSQAGLKRD